jgi:hypothetical protein
MQLLGMVSVVVEFRVVEFRVVQWCSVM